MSNKFDAIVIGSGQGGGPLSTAFVKAGKRTALIERGDIGGTCINTGCTPTKTMVASARTAYVAGIAAEYGVTIAGQVSIDMARVRARKRAIVDMFREGSEQAIRGGGVEIIRGSASFRSATELAVQTSQGEPQTLTAPLIVIDTGGRPSAPPIPGLDQVSFLDSTSVMELDSVPQHLVVLGGGYIGVEFAQMFRRFGSAVTIVENGSALLPNEDGDISDAVRQILTEDGIEILLDAKAVEAFERHDEISLMLQMGGTRREVSGSHLLVAAGRRPNVEDLNLDRAGVDLDAAGFIKVTDRLETTASGIYAIGDCAHSPPFTHISYDDFRILRANLLDGGDRRTTDRLVPYTVFIDPQLGRVGLTEKQARDKHLRFRVAKMEMTHVARAIESGETRGFMKMLVDPDSRKILGFAMLGMEGGEQMAIVEVAMMAGLSYTALRDGIFAHPTLAEAFNNLLSDLE